MELHCPDCGLTIPTSEVAPSAGLAVCRLCDRTYPLEACRHAKPLDARADQPLGPPPKGVTVAEGIDGFRLEISTRSCMALFLVPFTLFWAGGSLGGIYGTQIYKGEFSLWLSLFGIPFLLGSVFLIGFTVMTVAGRHMVELRAGRLHVHVGALGLRWGRSVDWRDVEDARLGEKSTRNYRPVHEVVVAVRGDKPLSFGSGVDAERLRWAVRFLATRIQRGR